MNEINRKIKLGHSGHFREKGCFFTNLEFVKKHAQYKIVHRSKYTKRGLNWKMVDLKFDVDQAKKNQSENNEFELAKNIYMYRYI